MIEAPEMKIRAIAPWFGSKRVMAPEIARQLGPHRAYWEPFCGSMAVLLAKPDVSQETVNDLHGDLINLARVLQHQKWGPWLYRQLRRQMVHQELFIEAAQRMRAQDKCDGFDAGKLVGEHAAVRASDFFYTSWMGRNGVIGTKGWNNCFSTRYTLNGGIQGVRFASAVDSIPAWRRRLREVTILRKDAFELLAKIEDQKGVALYCDPPYLSKGAEYLHDFADVQHGELAKLLCRFKRARVVVSYYASPVLAEMYPGWTQLRFDMAKSMSVQGKRGSKSETAPEILLINGPTSSGLHTDKEGLF